MSDRIIHLGPDWVSVALLSMGIFALFGARNGWQRGLVTLVSLFFAWGIAIKTIDALIAILAFIGGTEITTEARGLLQIALYLLAVVGALITFNSRVIPVVPRGRRDQLSGISTGLLNGYFFIVLLLDLGRQWLATHSANWQALFNMNLNSQEGSRALVLTIDFTNNPYVAYEQLIRAQNLIVLFLLLVIWQALIFAIAGRVSRELRPTVDRH